MHLQSSLFIAVSLITLGFASKTELDGNLAKKSLTDMKPNLVNSTDAIHDLVPRSIVQAMSCTIIIWGWMLIRNPQKPFPYFPKLYL
jgi:hypothetical protein